MSFFLKYFSQELKTGNHIIDFLKNDVCIKYFELVKVSLKEPIKLIYDGKENLLKEFILSKALLDKISDAMILRLNINFSKFNLQRNDLICDENSLITPNEIQEIVDKANNLGVDSYKNPLPTFIFLVSKDGEQFVESFEASRHDLYSSVHFNLFALLKAGLSKQALANYFPLELISYNEIKMLMENKDVVDEISSRWIAGEWNSFVKSYIEFKLLSNNTSFNGSTIPTQEKNKLKTYQLKNLNDWNNSHYTKVFDTLIRNISNEDEIFFKLKLVRSKLNKDMKINLDQIPFLIESFSKYSESEITGVILGNFISSHDAKFVGDFMEKVVKSRKADFPSENNVFEDSELKRCILYSKKINLRKLYNAKFPNISPDFKEMYRICLSGDEITSENLHNFIDENNAYALKEILMFLEKLSNKFKDFLGDLSEERLSVVSLKSDGIYFPIYVSEDVGSEHINNLLVNIINFINIENLNDVDKVDVITTKFCLDIQMANSKNSENVLRELDLEFKI